MRQKERLRVVREQEQLCQTLATSPGFNGGQKLRPEAAESMAWKNTDRAHESARAEHLKSGDTNFGLPVASQDEVRKVLGKDVITRKATLGEQARNLSHARV